MVNLPRSTAAYTPVTKSDEPLIKMLQEQVEAHPTIGFWSCYYRIRRAGNLCNHKRLYRVYTELNLNIRRRCKRRLPQRTKLPLEVPVRTNQTWSMDFMSDSLSNGRRYRLLNIIDDSNRQLLAMEVDTCLPALRVIRTLERLEFTQGLPTHIRMDNGPEFTSHILLDWMARKGIIPIHIQPGRPMQNAYIERCNGSIRRELLNAYQFDTLAEVIAMAETYRLDYNQHRPHQALGYQSPLKH
jgi:putative transposase